MCHSHGLLTNFLKTIDFENQFLKGEAHDLCKEHFVIGTSDGQDTI